MNNNLHGLRNHKSRLGEICENTSNIIENNFSLLFAISSLYLLIFDWQEKLVRYFFSSINEGIVDPFCSNIDDSCEVYKIWQGFPPVKLENTSFLPIYMWIRLSVTSHLIFQILLRLSPNYGLSYLNVLNCFEISNFLALFQVPRKPFVHYTINPLFEICRMLGRGFAQTIIIFILLNFNSWCENLFSIRFTERMFSSFSWFF